MRFMAVIALVLMTAACAGVDMGAGVPPNEPVGEGAIARCDEVPTLHAPDEGYRDEPVYVGNEMSVAEVQAWAAGRPAFEQAWIDHDRAGWISVAFSRDAQARQAGLEARFPGVGAVAVPVEWTMDELTALQDRVVPELRRGGDVGSGISVKQGVVSISVGVLTEDRLAAVADAFAGERVCVEGADPADVPVEGPQQTSGDGWRLLADEPEVGEGYRTGLATDEASYHALWAMVGMAGARPEVDFDAEIVVWFGAVHGSSCPNLRLDDVVVDRERALLHAEIVLVNPALVCTADAVPRAYVVAVQRAVLVPGPFAIQLSAEDPPSGLRRSAPWSTPTSPSPEPSPRPTRSAATPRCPNRLRSAVATSSRPAPRGPIAWTHAAVPSGWVCSTTSRGERGPLRDLPDPWRAVLAADGRLQLKVTIEPGSPPFATAVANGHTIVYKPSSHPPPAC